MQPRAKSRVFTSVDIGFHSLIAAFYLFLPQFCHSQKFTIRTVNASLSDQLSRLPNRGSGLKSRDLFEDQRAYVEHD